MIEHLITGLRISSMALWAMLFIRMAFYSWHITEGEPAVRVKGWRYFRLGVAILAVASVCFYGPRDILVAQDYITVETGLKLSAIATLLSSTTAALILTGLDIATGKNARALYAYLGIVAVSAVYGLTAGAI